MEFSTAPIPGPSASGGAAPERWFATWVAGPDAGTTVALLGSTGRWMVGRAVGAAVRCDDPALTLHHALLEMSPGGAATAGSSAGVPRATLLAAPHTHHDVGPPTCRLVPLGASWLLVHRSVPPPAVARPDGTVRRRARPHRPVPVPPREPVGATPEPGSAATGPTGSLALVSSLLGVGAAAVMALVLHQPMFLWFAVSGATVAAAGWAVQRAWQRRSDARAARARREAEEARLDEVRHHLLAQRRHHLATTPTVPRALHTALHLDESLWERRAADHDALVVQIGLDLHSGTPVPVAADLRHHRRVAVTGEHALAVVRAILLQLVAQCGPADLRLVVCTSSFEAPGPSLHPLTTAPHTLTCRPDELADFLGPLADDRPLRQHADADVAVRETLVVTDLVADLEVRTSHLRRALDAQPGVSVLCVGPCVDTPPLVCTAVLEADDAAVHWTPDRRLTDTASTAHLVGVGADTWARAMSSLARLTDPEQSDHERALEASVPITDVVDLDDDSVRRRWELDVESHPRTVIGRSHGGLVDLDLVRDGPHALVVGTTGSGKSDLLRALVLGIAAHSPPDLVQFVLVDFKGGSAFDACARLPHVVGLVTDLDGDGCARVLRSLGAELRRRERVLRERGVSDVVDLRRQGVEQASRVPRLVVVVDEFAVLAHERPELLHSLVDTARRGRSLGVHLVLATQRAAGSLSDDIRANTALRIALRVHDHGESRDVVGDDRAARLPRHAPGRAVVRLGDDEHVTFQTAHVSPVLTDAVDTMRRVAAETGRVARHRPWCEPLPTDLTLDACDDDVVGLIDDADAQCQRWLRWSAEEQAGLLLLGGPRSGMSFTLALFAARAHDRRVHLVTPQLDELALHRVLGAALADPDGVLMVDRLDLVRAELERDGREVHLEMLLHALRRHACIVVATATTAAVPSAVMARCTRRWSLPVIDPLDMTTIGLRPEHAPPPHPGRLVIAGPDDVGLAAQLLSPSSAAFVGRIDERETMATQARPSLGPDSNRNGRLESPGTLVVARCLATDVPVTVRIDPGEHLLVTGRRRSGRSTALQALSRSWSILHPAGRVVRLAGRPCGGPPVAAVVEQCAHSVGHTLLVIDDADAVDDVEGRLQSFLDDSTGRVSVVAALDPAALRGRYGHWTQVVRRHRTGLALLGGDDDGDTWGTVLPRRLPLSAEPGRCLVIDHGVVLGDPLVPLVAAVVP